MRVVPTAACDGTRFHSHLRAPAAIALVLGFNSSHVRPSFRRDPRASYVDSAQLVLRNIISLRRVNTSLPILLLVSGERDANFEELLSSQYRVRITESAGLRPPAWASPWMRGTFAKFGALTLHRYRRVIVLDSDTIVVKNIDHLSGAPPPLAAYFHFDMGSTCPQRPTQEGRCHLGVLNSGVLALEPDASRLAKARQLLTADDGSSLGEQSKDALWETSDQRLWHALYARDTVHELPFAYNANADANLTLGEWRHGVSILHDIVVQRKRGWARSGYAPLVDELTREAKRAFAVLSHVH